MKRKQLSLAIAALLAAGGLWLVRSAWRTHAFHKLSKEARSKTPDGSMSAGLETPRRQPKPGQMVHPPARPAPPDPTRRFTDFTPEQRVEFARKGHGPGG